MGPESIAHEADGRVGYWLWGHEGERNNNCFSKIQLVGQKNIEIEHFLLEFNPFLPPKHYKYGRRLIATSGL